jgi:TonB family protein
MRLALSVSWALLMVGCATGSVAQSAASSPKCAQGVECTVKMGSMDKELIRQVIRENIKEIRYCYERELTTSPRLAGTVTMKFIISATGAVSSSEVARSTVNNAGLEQCVAARMRTWTFPKVVGGGIVMVTYPFIFKPSVSSSPTDGYMPEPPVRPSPSPSPEQI